MKRLARPAPALLLAAIAASSGCSGELASAKLSLGSRDAGVAVAALPRKKAKGPQDRYVALRGKKPSPVGLGFYQTTPEVWSPFDVSFHFGLFDPKRKATADGSRACLEVDDLGFAIFYDICADYSAAMGGWTFLAFTGGPATPLPGSLFVAGDEAEARIDSDDATLTFSARAFGSPTWQEVASTPWPGQASALRASFGATQLARGTEIGFDDPSFVSAPAPGPLSAEGQVAADANQALVSGLDAYLSLDGASPDFAAATTALGLARTSLDTAIAGAAALPVTKTAKKAAKKLAKASKKLDRATAQVGIPSADKALKTLGKAALAVEEAVLLLVPQPL
jgi:hypothetical protein